MPLQRTTWTDRQIDVIVTAILDQKMTGPQAHRAGAAGELGLPPFTMPLSTVQYHAKVARRRRAHDRLPQVARDGLGLAVNAFTERLLTVAETLTNDLVAKGAKAQTQQAIQVTRLVQELAKLDRPTKPSSRGTDKGTRQAPKSPEGFVASLAATLPIEEPPPENDNVTTQENGESEALTLPRTPTHDETTPPIPQNGVSVHAGGRGVLEQVGRELG